MQQKTKKTSTDKPEATNLLAIAALTIAALSFIISIKNSPRPFFRSWTESNVKVGNCFTHKDGTVLAQVTKIYADSYGSHVEYAYLDTRMDDLGSNSRNPDDFEALYSFSDTCDAYTEQTTAATIRSLKQDVSNLRDRLDDARTEISALRKHK